MAGGKELLQILGLALISGVVLSLDTSGSLFRVLGLIGLGIAGLGIYLFPAIVGWEREHPNQVSIALLNLLLGWTFIGWVASIVWAYSAIPNNAAAEIKP